MFDDFVSVLDEKGERKSQSFPVDSSTLGERPVIETLIFEGCGICIDAGDDSDQGKSGKLIAEGLPDGTITREYLHMGKIRMAMVDVASQSVYYYLNDRLGTPQLMTDDTGTIVWEGFPKPFGEMTVNSKSTVVNNFRFAGQYYDGEIGLHYNYYRYYDPRTGRYLRPDPIGLSGGINRFIYASNNPARFIDALGLLDLAEIKATFKRPGDSAIRTAIQVLDIFPIPYKLYQIPLEVGAVITTVIDIWVADIEWYSKVGAYAVAVSGLLGYLQVLPSFENRALGTLVDVTAFVTVAWLLGEETSLDPVIRMIKNLKYITLIEDLKYLANELKDHCEETAAIKE